MRQPTSRIDAQTMRTLWPAPATLSGRGSAVSAYLAVPHSGAPRFLLPRDRVAAAGVLRHFRVGVTRADRRRHALLRLAVRTTGGWPLGLDVVTVSDPPGIRTATIERELAAVFGQEVTLGIQLGPPRANRKPVLQVLDARGRPLGVGKLAVDPLTRRLITAERAALDRIATLSLPGVEVPTVLHFGAWNRTRLLVMSPLPLARAVGDVPADQRVGAMVTVARAAGTSRQRLEGSACLDRMLMLAGRMSPGDPVRTKALDVLSLVSGRGDAWEFGAWHGDWTTWNMARHGDRLLLWDWERFEVGVPVGWDALHHALRSQLDTRPPSVGVTRQLLAAAPQLLAPFGVHPRDAHDVALSYLVGLALRYAGDGQELAGERSARVAEWLLPALPAA
jgi:hypothetical protein